MFSISMTSSTQFPNFYHCFSKTFTDREHSIKQVLEESAYRLRTPLQIFSHTTPLKKFTPPLYTT